MSFRILRNQLIAHVRQRVSNGELTERALARRTGISQPHLHNVLKGIRALSPEYADQILGGLGIGVADLIVEGDVQNPAYRMVGLLEGSIGPGSAYPTTESKEERYPFLEADAKGLECPVAVKLAPDPMLAHLYTHSAVALLDRSEQCRANPDEQSYYALDLGAGSAIRRLRIGEGRLIVHSASSRVAVELERRSILRLIQGRVSMIVRRF